MVEMGWRRRTSAVVIGVTLAVAASLADPAAAVEPEDFVVEDASTLAQLCSVGPEEPYYVEAIHMCHGFASGVAQYALLLFTAAGGEFLCTAEPAPPRSEVIAEYVTWLGENPEFATVEAPEAIVRFLRERFPCS